MEEVLPGWETIFCCNQVCTAHRQVTCDEIDNYQQNILLEFDEMAEKLLLTIEYLEGPPRTV